MNIFQRFVSGLGAQNMPYGLAPNDPQASYRAGLQYMGDLGSRLMANNQGGVSGGEILGASMTQAKDMSRQRAKEDMAAKVLFDQAEENRRKREEEAQRQKWMDEQISQLSPDQQALAKFNPEKYFGAKIDAQFSSPDMTDDMKEYQWAVQNGYQGTPMDYMTTMKRPPASYGTIPPGYQLVQDGNTATMVPIPGSPAEQEQQQAATARQNKANAQTTTADMMVEDIDRTLNTVEGSTLPTTGLGGSLLKNVPGTSAGDVNYLLTGIKANIGFDRLQRMREESPTGGALGQVAVQELEALQSIYGSLQQSQSRDQFDYNLKRLKNKYLDIVHGPGMGPPREQLNLRRGNAGKTSSGVEWRVEE